jgi:catechol 2,3-dioxygenase-like lactoylglutathione lyase family enzyme
MTDTTDLKTIPTLASLDFDETLAFYGDVLGFACGYRDDDYLILIRGPLELHFWRTGDRAICEATSCYIRGGGVPALYEAFRTRPFGRGRISHLVVRPWGMQEFYIWDPHGNLLRFGCAPQETAG